MAIDSALLESLSKKGELTDKAIETLTKVRQELLVEIDLFQRNGFWSKELDKKIGFVEATNLALDLLKPKEESTMIQP